MQLATWNLHQRATGSDLLQCWALAAATAAQTPTILSLGGSVEPKLVREPAPWALANHLISSYPLARWLLRIVLQYCTEDSTYCGCLRKTVQATTVLRRFLPPNLLNPEARLTLLPLRILGMKGIVYPVNLTSSSAIPCHPLSCSRNIAEIPKISVGVTRVSTVDQHRTPLWPCGLSRVSL